MVELRFRQTQQIDSGDVQHILHEIFMPINLLSSKLIFSHNQMVKVLEIVSLVAKLQSP